MIQQLKTTLAGIYGISPDSVYLFKSGRAGIRGLLEALKRRDPDRTTVFIPDYVCNVVERACVAAGFEVLTYPTDPDCMPVWQELKSLLMGQAHPTLMLCSLFGTVPLLHPDAQKLLEKFPSLFLIADECQNLVSKPQIRPALNLAVILSFNDKTCPGYMGGALLDSHETELPVSYTLPNLRNRLLCALGLCKLMLRSIYEHIQIRILKLLGRTPRFDMPEMPEYSMCNRPHYDCEAEPIYRLSALRALYCLKQLPRYEAVRIQNVRILTDKGLISSHNHALSESPPPFIPVDGPCESLPFPLKAPYAYEPGNSKRPQAYAIKINKSSFLKKY